MVLARALAGHPGHLATGAGDGPGSVGAVFVKICGITHPDDAAAAVDAGADALGFVFAPSRRQVDVATATSLVAGVDPAALTVGVFRNHTADEVIEIVEAVGLDAVQLHGRETVETCRRVHRHVPVLIRAVDAADPLLATLDDAAPDAVHLDSPTPGAGIPFDWSLVGDLTVRRRVILAGGLRPENVAEAIGTVGPWGVDVSTGVEASPGRKDPEAVRAFVQTARDAAVGRPQLHPPFERPERERNPA